jgi:hypothetical protein
MLEKHKQRGGSKKGQRIISDERERKKGGFGQLTFSAGY